MYIYMHTHARRVKVKYSTPLGAQKEIEYMTYYQITQGREVNSLLHTLCTHLNITLRKVAWSDR